MSPTILHETCRRHGSKISIISNVLTLAKKSPTIKPAVFARKIDPSSNEWTFYLLWNKYKSITEYLLVDFVLTLLFITNIFLNIEIKMVFHYNIVFINIENFGILFKKMDEEENNSVVFFKEL